MKGIERERSLRSLLALLMLVVSLTRVLLDVTFSKHGTRITLTTQTVHYVDSPLLDVLASFRGHFITLIM